MVETTRRVYLVSELYPEEEQRKLPYFAAHAETGMKHTLLFFMHEGGVLFGLAGLERREGEGEFTASDVAKLEALGPFVAAGARAQIAYDEPLARGGRSTRVQQGERHALRRRPRAEEGRLGRQPRPRHRLGRRCHADRGPHRRRGRALARVAREGRGDPDASAPAVGLGRRRREDRGRPRLQQRQVRDPPRRAPGQGRADRGAQQA